MIPSLARSGARVGHPRRLQPLHWAIAALVATALWQFGQASYIHAKAWLAQYLIRAAWERTLATGAPVKPWSWADTWPVARLVAADRGVDLFVLAGDSGRSLAFGPGHRFGTAQPGARGNAVISAHRDTHFAFLRDLPVGAILALQSADGQWHRYEVTETAVAHQSALRILADRGAAELTLVTCWPFDALAARGPMRYVVRGRWYDPARHDDKQEPDRPRGRQTDLRAGVGYS